MHYCQVCQQQVAVGNSPICLPCLDQQYETVVWPQVRAILPAIHAFCAQTDPRPVFQARRAFVTALSEITVPLEAVTPMPNAAPVQVAQQNIPIWTAYEAHAKTYREQVSQASPAWEFQMLLVQAQQQSRHDRTVLLARDGFDVAQWRWLSGYFPLTPAARTAHLMTRNHYETYARILRSGMLMLIIALQEQLPLIAAIQGAAQVMREEELKSIPLTLMWLGTQPHAIVQHWAQSALSGWITAQTWLSPSVRKALDAQQLSPARFFEFLGDEVRQAQQEGIDTPQALLTTVRRRIDALRQTGQTPP